MKNIQIDILDKLTPEIIQEMQHIHFVADYHFDHPKIVDICNRPVYVSLDRNDPKYKYELNKVHNEWLIKEVHNKYVQKHDAVYILGDFSLGNRKDAEKHLDRLNGNKFLVMGNHDKSVYNSTRFSQITQIKDFAYSQHGINIHIVLCHYPLASWNRKVHGSWMLYGHVHGRFENTGLSWDVGIDNQNNKYSVFGWCRPINLYEVIQIMHEKQKQGITDNFSESVIEVE